MRKIIIALLSAIIVFTAPMLVVNAAAQSSLPALEVVMVDLNTDIATLRIRGAVEGTLTANLAITDDLDGKEVYSVAQDTNGDQDILIPLTYNITKEQILITWLSSDTATGVKAEYIVSELTHNAITLTQIDQQARDNTGPGVSTANDGTQNPVGSQGGNLTGQRVAIGSIQDHIDAAKMWFNSLEFKWRVAIIAGIILFVLFNVISSIQHWRRNRRVRGAVKQIEQSRTNVDKSVGDLNKIKTKVEGSIMVPAITYELPKIPDTLRFYRNRIMEQDDSRDYGEIDDSLYEQDLSLYEDQADEPYEENESYEEDESLNESQATEPEEVMPEES